ncbi:MAG: hypothetical protein NTU83_14010 [Candidatus Hydrogenedentes bacterium]|nr:hypothetical protein [Candidatus Hydrogenedentota bacterium]
MQNRHSKSEFIALLAFLIVATLVLTNGFVARISAQGKDVDVFAKIQPIGDVLGIILDEYVRVPNIYKVVEVALVGIERARPPQLVHLGGSVSGDEGRDARRI